MTDFLSVDLEDLKYRLRMVFQSAAWNKLFYWLEWTSIWLAMSFQPIKFTEIMANQNALWNRIVETLSISLRQSSFKNQTRSQWPDIYYFILTIQRPRISKCFSYTVIFYDVKSDFGQTVGNIVRLESLKLETFILTNCSRSFQLQTILSNLMFPT